MRISINNNQNNWYKLILDLCGATGAWSRPYKEAGYDVRIITLPDNDVRTYIPPNNVYGILAAPPCTHFAGSGARWWKGKGKEALLEGLAAVDACMRIILISNPTFWALENPVGRLSRYIGKPVMYFQPWEFGDKQSKRTCLWGKFNPPAKKPIKYKWTKEDVIFQPVNNGKKVGWNTEECKMLRSITPPGFAKAFFKANK